MPLKTGYRAALRYGCNSVEKDQTAYSPLLDVIADVRAQCSIRWNRLLPAVRRALPERPLSA